MSTPRANTVRSIIFGTNIHLEKQGATLQDSDPWLATKQYQQITVWEEVLQRGTSVLKKKACGEMKPILTHVRVMARSKYGGEKDVPNIHKDHLICETWWQGCSGLC